MSLSAATIRLAKQYYRTRKNHLMLGLLGIIVYMILFRYLNHGLQLDNFSLLMILLISCLAFLVYIWPKPKHYPTQDPYLVKVRPALMKDLYPEARFVIRQDYETIKTHIQPFIHGTLFIYGGTLKYDHIQVSHFIEKDNTHRTEWLIYEMRIPATSFASRLPEVMISYREPLEPQNGLKPPYKSIQVPGHSLYLISPEPEQVLNSFNDSTLENIQRFYAKTHHQMRLYITNQTLYVLDPHASLDQNWQQDTHLNLLEIQNHYQHMQEVLMYLKETPFV